MAITDFSQLDLTKQYTFKDYLSWKFKERVELFRGFVAKMSPAPTSKHQLIVGEIYLEIGTFIRKKSCKVFIAPFDVYLKTNDKKTVVQPDICVVCDPTKIKKQGCVGSPDLVVEILSPGNSKKEMNDKYELYQESGVNEYWVVYPSEQVLQQYFLENGVFVPQKPLPNGSTLRSRVLVDFEMEIDTIFNNF